MTDEGQQKRPTGDATAQRVVFKYPSEGGYQPGDIWELYVGADKRIEEIVYRRGAAKPLRSDWSPQGRSGVTLVYPPVGASFSNRSQSSG